jgi:inosose dehydratase
MRELGLAATELGPTGYLGATPTDIRETLADCDMRLVGGFLPVAMHVDAALDLAEATKAIAALAAGGSEVVVLAARSGDGSYDHKVVLDDDGWQILLGNLDRLVKIVHEHGLRPTLHPHVGTAVEDRESVLRLLDSSPIDLCLDTGHLVIGGMQPLELLDRAVDRVAHVHLKDVNLAVAAQVSAGTSSYIDAVHAGLYTPLGAGDLDIAAIVSALTEVGYRGWYVLEQDSALSDEPASGTGPIDDVRRSLEFLDRVA